MSSKHKQSRPKKRKKHHPSYPRKRIHFKKFNYLEQNYVLSKEQKIGAYLEALKESALSGVPVFWKL